MTRALCIKVGTTKFAIAFPKQRAFVLFMNIIRFIAISVFLGWSFTPSLSYAQWYHISGFDGSVQIVKFMEHTPTPQIGFVAIGYGAGNIDLPSLLWRTDDGGLHWISLQSTIQDHGGIYDFAFKDGSTGWFGGISNSNSLFKTIDGGIIWFPVAVAPLMNTNKDIYGLNYHNGNLFLNGTNCSPIISQDEGATFTDQTNTNDCVSYSTVFSTPTLGIILFGDGIPGCTSGIKRTTDGGQTWTRYNNFAPNCWQPLGIQGSGTFYATGPDLNGYYADSIYRSVDSGLTWHGISQVALTTQMITGTEDSLYIQTYKNDSLHWKGGVYRSTDKGITWQSLCGPLFQYQHTRFYVRANYIYAADLFRYGINHSDSSRLWVNTTGLASDTRIKVNSSSGTHAYELTTGNLISVSLTIPDTLPTLPAVIDSIAIQLTYDTLLSYPKTVTPAPGWKLLRTITNGNRFIVQLQREPATTPNGSTIGTVTFATVVSGSTTPSFDIYADTVWYNQGEVINCDILESESVHITFADRCGDSILRAFLQKTAGLKITSITPNPTTDKITLEFYSAEKADVQIELIDALGNEVKSISMTASAGTNATVLTMPDQAGVYHLRLSTPRQTVTEKVIRQ